MKGINFYAEFENEHDKRDPDIEAQNVVAVFCEGHTPIVNPVNGCYEGMAATFDRANSPVSGTAISPEVLRKRCKRISEARAREIHPKLFERLDN